MNKVRFDLLAGVVSCTVAWAQDSTPYDGKWRATYKTQSGGSATAELALQGSKGTWKYVSNRKHQANTYACLDQEFPVVVQSSSPSELKFAIDASKVIRGCKDRHVTVKLLDGKNLEGQFGDGAALTLTRE